MTRQKCKRKTSASGGASKTSRKRNPNGQLTRTPTARHQRRGHRIRQNTGTRSTGRALAHPAAPLLMEWAQFGCPTKTGQPWTKEEIWYAVERGPHQSAHSEDAIKNFAVEAAEKVRTKQARIVDWDSIKDNPPKEIKILPIAAIPHRSKAYISILDLSFRLHLKNGGIRTAVNDTTEKTAPKGAIDQIGEALSRIVHTFAEADEDAKIFMSKWAIKDGFWRMDCTEGEEWNFTYVLPQNEGEPIKIVVPT